MTFHGIHPTLEAAADELLFAQTSEQSRSEKTDILTPDKQRRAYSREVYNLYGVADPQLRKGMYNRAANTVMPHLNSRDCPVRARRWDSKPGDLER